jgi:acetate kinase
LKIAPAPTIHKVIGAYVALLGGVDLLVFTGGIGEHSDYVRSAVTSGLEFLGLTADKIKIVSAEEEQQIARHCRRMMGQPR